MKTILILVLLVSITLATPVTFAQTAIDGFSSERATADPLDEPEVTPMIR